MFGKAGKSRIAAAPLKKLAKLRRGDNRAPIDIRRLAEECCRVWDEKEEDSEQKKLLQHIVEGAFSVISEATGMDSVVNEPKGRNTEKLSKEERKSSRNIVNMFGIREKHKKTRAHQLPSSRACNVFWGMVCEALSGIDMDGFSDEKKLFVRSEMARMLARFKLDLFAFANAHNSFYNLLEDGLCVMIIPLLTL
jgi:hypothetical protein